jgi:hypothetical protein
MAKKVRVWWHNPPGATARLTVESSGEARDVGPRGLLTLAEAAAVLDRSEADVRAAIRTRFLRAVRRGSSLYVTLQALISYAREEQRDTEIADRTMRDIRSGRVKLIPWKQVRERLLR